jgi:hypothetical protein
MPEQDTSPVSFDLFYLTKGGMEAHLQLKGATVDEVLRQADSAATKVTKAGGTARPRASRGGHSETSGDNGTHNCASCGQPMAYREGTSKSGKDYKGFFCPDRECEGEPVWVNS